MISIGTASRQTGIPATTLRKWEARYGFPVPLRTAGAQRAYRSCDLDALIDVARRMAAGQRAGAAIGAVKLGTFNQIAVAGESSVARVPVVSQMLELLLQNQLQTLEERLVEQLQVQGAAAFVREVAMPLVKAVGIGWQQGRLAVYSEHFFSSILQRVLLQERGPSISAVVAAPKVLLASPAGELHSLALVMLNAVLRQVGVPTVVLQGGLPAAEIAGAAEALRVQVVALSASASFPPRLLASELRCLRSLLHPATELWVGGAGSLRMQAALQGVQTLASFDAAACACKKLAEGVPAHIKNERFACDV